MKSVKVITFGELLLRLSPDLASNSSAIFVGGAEANVAAALARWGTPVAYISKAPENGFSRDVLKQLSDRGIATDRMLWGGDRIGIYYLAQGSDLKHAEVVYDRKYSSFSQITPGTVNWDELLGDAEWFHWSAISPALNPDAAVICKEVLEAATRKGMTISTDLNYRSKLWQYGKQPHEVMPELVAYCDVVMGNIWAAHTMLGTTLDNAALEADTKTAYLEQAVKVATEITAGNKRCKRVAFTFRFSKDTTHAQYYTFYYHNRQTSISKEYETQEVVDRVGSGDCFMAGLIHAQLEGKDDQGIISFAAAAAYSKFFVKGDFNTTSYEDIIKLM
ncbi:2-dehydro-3-deoxygluconokinase [Chitinophaga eiseniae]|uniref:2-dehydro-3-deoxygluconokinase n=1 Tax=Chitinophaga eiseniae TaxID=634771 RepID=A0A1T4Q3I7_9BACT|nr:sugar kinase [Chitinophaga eiseniae]SJZ98224.1 2-dehydro-3-deoxygluconokinase [Chitinophaga eiseniae]